MHGITCMWALHGSRRDPRARGGAEAGAEARRGRTLGERAADSPHPQRLLHASWPVSKWEIVSKACMQTAPRTPPQAPSAAASARSRAPASPSGRSSAASAFTVRSGRCCPAGSSVSLRWVGEGILAAVEGSVAACMYRCRCAGLSPPTLHWTASEQESCPAMRSCCACAAAGGPSPAVSAELS